MQEACIILILSLLLSPPICLGSAHIISPGISVYLCPPLLRNLWIDDNDLGKFTTLGLDGESIEKPKRLYQILTDTGSFTICGIKFMDYNSAIEQIMGDAWSMDQGLFSV